jgi:hypothetical protein
MSIPVLGSAFSSYYGQQIIGMRSRASPKGAWKPAAWVVSQCLTAQLHL